MAMRLARLLFWFLCCACLNAHAALEVTGVSPSGDDVSGVKQIVLSFNKDLTGFPYGAIDEVAANIAITPTVDCHWMFLNRRTVACNVLGNISEATDYSVVVYPAMQSQDGSALASPYRHNFVTTRPKVVFSSINKWFSAGKPMILLVTNQRVSKSSIESSAYFIDSKNVRYSVIAEPDTSAKPELFGMKNLIKGVSNNKNVSDGYRTSWLVKPKKELPGQELFSLIVAPGLSSISGNQVSLNEQKLLDVRAFGEFKVLDAKCVTISNKVASILKYDERVKCNASMPIIFVFSNPVDLPSFIRSTLITPGTIDIKEGAVRASVHPINVGGGKLVYEVAVSNRWSPGAEYTIKLNNDSRSIVARWISYFIRIFNKNYGSEALLHDQFNSVLTQEALVVKFTTGHASPDVGIRDRYLILDKNSDSDVSIDTTNVQSLTYDYRAVYGSELKPHDESANIKIKDPGRDKVIPGIFANSVLFANKSGVVYGNISSFPKIERSIYTTALFVENTLFSLNATVNMRDVFVTLFDRKTSVAIDDAMISLIKWDWEQNKQWEVVNSSVTKGGYAIVDMPTNSDLDKEHFCILAKSGDDIAILPLNNRFIRGSEGNYSLDNVLSSWGTTDKAIYRAGETVKYKIYLRSKFADHDFSYRSKSYTVSLLDSYGRKVSSSSGLKLSSFGALNGEIALDAKVVVGRYSITVSDGGNNVISPVEFIVDNFQNAYSAIKTSVNANVFTSSDKVEIAAVGWFLHNKDPLRGAGVSSRIALRSTSYVPRNPLLSGFTFGNNGTRELNIGYVEGVFDENGRALLSYNLSTNKDITIDHGELIITTISQDVSGKYLTSRTSAEFFKADKLVGVMIPEGAFAQKESIVIRSAIVDTKGQLVDQLPIYITIDYSENGSWKKQKAFKLNSDAHDVSSESISFSKIGKYRVTAEISNGHKSYSYFYVVRDKSTHIPPASSDGVSIKAIKDSFVVGDTAQYVIDNPYDEADAVFTVAKDRVLDTFTQKISKGASIVQFDILPKHAPGFNLYMDVMSKQADNYFASTYSGVTDPNNIINFAVAVDKPYYKDKEDIIVTIQTTHASPVEVALIIVNRATLNAAGGTHTYDIREFFSKNSRPGARNYALFVKPNYNIAPRLLMDSSNMTLADNDLEVLYWNPSIITSSSGSTSISLPNPGALSEWVVMAVAVDEYNAMGYAETTFSSGSEIEVFASFPSHVVSGDKFQAKFIAHNKTNEVHNIKVVTNSGFPEESMVQESIQPGEIVTIRKEEIAHKHDVATEVFVNGPSNLIYSKRYMTASLPNVQQKLRNAYGVTHGALSEDLHYLKGDRPAILLRAFQAQYPLISKLAQKSLENSSSYTIKSWEGELQNMVAIAVRDAANFKMGVGNSAISWDVQNRLLSANRMQNASGAMSDNTSPEDNFIESVKLTAKTVIQFNNLKSMGYIIPIDAENKMIKFLTSYYDNNRSAKNSVLILVGRAINKTIEAELVPSINDMDLMDRVNYLYAINSKAEAQKIADHIMSRSFRTSGITYLTSSAPFMSSGTMANCEAILALNGLIDEAQLAGLVRYTLNSMHDYIGRDETFCLGNIYIHSLRFDGFRNKHVAFYINKNLLIDDVLNRDIAVLDVSAMDRDIDHTLLSIDVYGGKGGVEYMTQAITDSQFDTPEANGIRVSRNFSVVDGNAIRGIVPPYTVKVGDIVMAEIVMNSAVPLKHVDITENIPGGMEIMSMTPLHLSRYLADPAEAAVMYLPSMYYSSFASGVVARVYNVEAGRDYNIRYFTHAKNPGDFTALATVVSVENMDISGHGTTDVIHISEASTCNNSVSGPSHTTIT